MMNASGAKLLGSLRGKAQKKRRVNLRCVFNGELSKRQKWFIKFLLGGVGYGLIELLWRGRTHFSMVITGGACLVAVCALNTKMQGKNIFLRAAACAAAITAVEFCVGMLVNRLWHMNVWDYSGEKLHLLGQICPKYTVLWFMLSLPLSMAVSRVIKASR